jgi:hypothetical protein
MAIPFKTEKHTRTFQFENGVSLLVSNIVEIELGEDVIAMTKSDEEIVLVYRDKLTFCTITGLKE